MRTMHAVRWSLAGMIFLLGACTTAATSLSAQDTSHRFEAAAAGAGQVAPVHETDKQETALDHDGRTLFMTLTTAKTAVMLPQVFRGAFPDIGGRTMTGLSLLGIGATLYGTYALTQDVALGYGKVALMNYGATLGYVYPMQISTFLHNGTRLDREFRRYDQDGNEGYEGTLPSTRIQAWTTMLAVPYSIYVAWRVPVVDNDAFGNASIITYFSQTVGAMGYLLPLYRYDPDEPQESRPYLTTASAMTMGLIPIGAWIGADIVEGMEYSSGRGALLYLTGAMGTLTGMLLPTLLKDQPLEQVSLETAHITGGIAGYLLGSAFGLRFRPERDFTFWQSVFIGASAASGSLVGLSVPYIARSGHQEYFTAAAIGGAWAGLLLGERMSLAISERLPADRQNLSASRLELSLPGLWSIPALLGSGGGGEGAVEIAGLKYRF